MISSTPVSQSLWTAILPEKNWEHHSGFMKMTLMTRHILPPTFFRLSAQLRKTRPRIIIFSSSSPLPITVFSVILIQPPQTLQPWIWVQPHSRIACVGRTLTPTPRSPLLLLLEPQSIPLYPCFAFTVC